MSEASPTVKGRICFCNSYLFFPVYISFSFTNKKIKRGYSTFFRFTTWKVETTSRKKVNLDTLYKTKYAIQRDSMFIVYVIQEYTCQRKPKTNM